MSNLVFPILPGLSWGVSKYPIWSTKIQRAVSGKEYRNTLFSQPLYTFKLKYELLRASTAFPELQQLLAFFNARQGSFDNFLYTDPTDNSVTGQSIGTGNAVATQFQLVRSYGGNVESAMNVNSITNISINGTPTVAYTIDGFGLVTFNTAPANGAALTWTGSYYYRCRFAKDSSEFENFMYQLWELKTLELLGSLGNKI